MQVFVDGNVTFPPGSTWARNPIPRIWDSKKGLHNPSVCPGPSARAAGSPPGCLAFPAPCPWDTYLTHGMQPCVMPPEGGLHKCDGDGMGECSSDWVVGVISDHVLIPADLPPGEYVLGWRWCVPKAENTPHSKRSAALSAWSPDAQLWTRRGSKPWADHV